MCGCVGIVRNVLHKKNCNTIFFDSNFCFCKYMYIYASNLAVTVITLLQSLYYIDIHPYRTGNYTRTHTYTLIRIRMCTSVRSLGLSLVKTSRPLLKPFSIVWLVLGPFAKCIFDTTSTMYIRKLTGSQFRAMKKEPSECACVCTVGTVLLLHVWYLTTDRTYRDTDYQLQRRFNYI